MYTTIPTVTDGCSVKECMKPTEGGKQGRCRVVSVYTGINDVIGKKGETTPDLSMYGRSANSTNVPPCAVGVGLCEGRGT